MFQSILAFDFDLVLETFWLLGPNGQLLRFRHGSETTFSASHVADLSFFSTLPSILNFGFGPKKESFLAFRVHMGYFWVYVRSKITLSLGIIN